MLRRFTDYNRKRRNAHDEHQVRERGRVQGVPSGRQLTHGGIVDLFDHRFSIDDTAKRHKPAPEAYAEVTRGLAPLPRKYGAVACHTWDSLRAQAVGWEAGLIKRANNDVLDTAAQLQYVGKDLNAIADQIIARHQGPPLDGSNRRRR
jgi:2-haloacid dehalogenase